ncbi:MAG: ABC transporter substrate-binding protein [Chloroflexi bacterium]|nr:ABC transporter substrate-binding protein [Chloroflexota bacterium]
MSKLSRVLIVVALTALVLAACAPAATPTPTIIEKEKIVKETQVVQVQVTPVPKEPIRIGLHAPFSGAVAYMGEDGNMGVTMAIEEINAAGGILGHPLKLYIADNACSTDGAVSAVRKLIEVDQVHALTGGYCSSATLGSMPIIEQYGVPQVTEASSNSRITEMAGKGGNIWQFRVNPHDGIMASGFSKTIAETAKSVCILAANNDFGRGAAGNFDKNFKLNNVEVKAIEYFEQGQPDYHSLLTKWKGLNPDAVLLIMESHDGAIFMRQFREVGMTAKVFGRGSLVSPEFLKDIQDDLTLGAGIMEATFGAVGANPEFDQRFKERWGHLPHVHSLAGYNAVRYALAEGIRIAIETTGKATRESIREGLTKVDLQDTLLGPCKFDEYNQAHGYIDILTLDDKGNATILSRVIAK